MKACEMLSLSPMTFLAPLGIAYLCLEFIIKSQKNIFWLRQEPKERQCLFLCVCLCDIMQLRALRASQKEYFKGDLKGELKRSKSSALELKRDQERYQERAQAKAQARAQARAQAKAKRAQERA